jgi:hypothetical protein
MIRFKDKKVGGRGIEPLVSSVKGKVPISLSNRTPSLSKLAIQPHHNTL